MQHIYSQRAEQIVLTVWVGSLLAIGYLAVPILFNGLADRQLAGELAGQMFRIVHIIGLVSALILLLLSYIIDSNLFLRQWRHYLLMAMIVCILIAIFVLQPQMATIKGQPGWYEMTALKQRFGMLHGVSSLLYLLTSIMGVILIMMGMRRK